MSIRKKRHALEQREARIREPSRILSNGVKVDPARNRPRLTAGAKAHIDSRRDAAVRQGLSQGAIDTDRPYLIVVRRGDGRIIRKGDVFTALPRRRIRPGDKCVLWPDDRSPGLIAYRSSARARPIFKDLVGGRILRGDWVAIHFICETGGLSDLSQ